MVNLIKVDRFVNPSKHSRAIEQLKAEGSDLSEARIKERYLLLGGLIQVEEIPAPEEKVVAPAKKQVVAEAPKKEEKVKKSKKNNGKKSKKTA